MTAIPEGLPPLADAMTPADLLAHKAAIQKMVGPKCDSTVFILGAGTGACIVLNPFGISGAESKTISGKTWKDCFEAAWAIASGQAAEVREKRIRQLALALVDLSYAEASPSVAISLVVGRGFSKDEIEDIGRAAENRAALMLHSNHAIVIAQD